MSTDPDPGPDKEPLRKKGARSVIGAPRKFEGPEELQAAVSAYFQWLEDNPLKEPKLIAYQGEGSIAYVPQMRAATLAGVCLHIGVTTRTWQEWRKSRPDLSRVLKWAEDCIREQKFTGAAAGLFNANIIARDLGLADRQEQSSPDDGPIPVAVDHVELARQIAFIIRRGAEAKPRFNAMTKEAKGGN